LEKVLFMPAGNPYMKDGMKVSPASLRYEMVRLGLNGEKDFELCDLEIHMCGDTHTAETMALLAWQYSDAELYFIMGWDNLEKFHTWVDPEIILQYCAIIAFPRVGYAVPDPTKLYIQLPELEGKLTVLNKPFVDISASLIRERVAANLPLNYLLTSPVASFINKHHLYETGDIGVSGVCPE
ncbi:MAG: nicotinate (nicotinamide) nucleotide adenylyltransferase, partial [Chloroflexi bacterium]|nr:nicotinate (nicotinamide) nucleotide adenylyltransferase [Chloroflexota bacterium]